MIGMLARQTLGDGDYAGSSWRWRGVKEGDRDDGVGVGVERAMCRGQRV